MYNVFRHFNILFAFLMGLVFLPFIATMGPVVEMKLDPVVSRSVITHIERNDVLEEMLFWGEATKLRQCNYDHVEWFSGDPNGAHSRLTMEIKENGAINNKGDKFAFGPIKVYINEYQLRNNTFAVVYHDCHWFWLSQSVFYP